MKTVYHPKTGKAVNCENHQVELMIKAGYKKTPSDEKSEGEAPAETKGEAKPQKTGK